MRSLSRKRLVGLPFRLTLFGFASCHHKFGLIKANFYPASSSPVPNLCEPLAVLVQLESNLFDCCLGHCFSFRQWIVNCVSHVSTVSSDFSSVYSNCDRIRKFPKTIFRVPSGAGFRPCPFRLPPRFMTNPLRPTGQGKLDRCKFCG